MSLGGISPYSIRRFMAFWIGSAVTSSLISWGDGLTSVTMRPETGVGTSDGETVVFWVGILVTMELFESRELFDCFEFDSGFWEWIWIGFWSIGMGSNPWCCLTVVGRIWRGSYNPRYMLRPEVKLLLLLLLVYNGFRGVFEL